jgi:hypothetical protein
MRPRTTGLTFGTALCAVALFAAGVQTGAQAPAPGGQGAPPAPAAPGSVQGTPAQDFDRGAAVLAEARKAIGGDERLKAVQRFEMRGKSARAMGQGNFAGIEGDFEFQFEFPDKFRRKESLTIGGGQAGIDLTQLLSGAEVSEESSFASNDFGNLDGDGGGGRGGRGGRGGNANIGAILSGTLPNPDATPEEQRQAQHRAVSSEMSRLAMVVLLRHSDPVAWIGTAESPDGTADVLEFKTPDGTATQLLIDSKTRMPLMLSWTGVSVQMGGRGGRGGGGARGGRGGIAAAQTTLQLYVSDYKTVNGLRLPHLIQRGPNGETAEEFVVRNYRINPNFRAGFFEK